MHISFCWSFWFVQTRNVYARALSLHRRVHKNVNDTVNVNTITIMHIAFHRLVFATRTITKRSPKTAPNGDYETQAYWTQTHKRTAIAFQRSELYFVFRSNGCSWMSGHFHTTNFPQSIEDETDANVSCDWTEDLEGNRQRKEQTMSTYARSERLSRLLLRCKNRVRIGMMW